MVPEALAKIWMTTDRFCALDAIVEFTVKYSFGVAGCTMTARERALGPSRRKTFLALTVRRNTLLRSGPAESLYPRIINCSVLSVSKRWSCALSRPSYNATPLRRLQFTPKSRIRRNWHKELLAAAPVKTTFRGEMTGFGVGDRDLIGLVRKDGRANDLRRRRTPINRWLQIRHLLDGIRRGPDVRHFLDGIGDGDFSRSRGAVSALALLPPKNSGWNILCNGAGAP